MKSKFLKRLSALILSGALVLGSCGFASAEPYTAAGDVQTTESGQYVTDADSDIGADISSDISSDDAEIISGDDTGDISVSISEDADAGEDTGDVSVSISEDAEAGDDAAAGASSDAAQEDVTIPESGITAAVTGSGSVTVSDDEAESGETVTVTATPGDGYYLAQVRYTYEDDSNEITKVIEDTGSGYQFTMPADAAVVTADFISIVWDGTIDLTWYDSDDSVYTLSYAAQLEGAAALVNGLFNNYPMQEEIDSDGATYELPHTTDNDLPYGYEETYYNSFSSDDGTTVVVGDITQLKAICTAGSTGSNNLVTTNDWWSGAVDFAGKTIQLDADLDMGGSYTGDDCTDLDSWSGPNYMPVGGQYSMVVGNGYTKLTSGFNGTFDGQGHIVSNIYCYRQQTGNFGDNESIALIGRLGVSSSDDVAEGVTPTVENVAVTGMIYGNRSVGGIVGRTGYSEGAVVTNCMNFATIRNTDAKGVGGIVGAGWNELTIENCVNFGYIYTSYSNAGGICGNCECDVVNCYNFGYVNASKVNQAQALGTNAGGAVFTNCYYLTGSARSTDYPAVYGSVTKSTYTEITSADTFKTSGFIELINADTRDWVLADEDTMISSKVQSCLENIYAYTSELESYDGTGIAIPRTFMSDDSYITGITTSGTPVTSYYSGKSFDADTFQIWANYSDNTKEAITDYTVTYENGGTVFSADDTSVTVSGTYGGFTYSYTFDVSVTATELASIAITTAPDNVLYAIGETFDPTGMVLKATFTNGITEEVTDYTYDKTGKLSEVDTVVTISYTYQDVTLTATQTIEILSSTAPHQGDGGIVEIETADDMRWFANKVTLGHEYDAILMDDIDLTDSGFTPIGYASSPVYYTGVFYGNDKTVTISYGSASTKKTYSALFCGLSETGVIQDVTVQGDIYGASYTAGIVSRVIGGTVKNCVSYVDITSSSSYVGGITAYTTDGAQITDCVNYGSITSTNYIVGGIAGILEGEEDLVDTCLNFGSVCGLYSVGGIVGQSKNTNTIQYCGNEGSVEATGSSSSSRAMGGVLGYSTSAVTVDSCYNTGEVTASCYAGGVAGYASSSSAAITNCYNSGSISSESTHTGGVAGRIGTSTAIQNCYNSGTLTYLGSATSYNLGAIAAYAGSKTATLSAVSNNYALEGTGDALIGYKSISLDSYATYVSADTLKTLAQIADGEESSALGSAYTDAPEAYNNGYPMLSWQLDSSFYAEALIDAIGEVTLESADKITLARTVYDALDEDVQADVSNLAVLTAAEAAYASWLTYGDEVSAVILLIDAIGEVTLDSGDAITAARTAYDALEEDAQAIVTNIDTLTEAEAAYAELVANQAAAEAVIALIDAIGEVTLDSGDAITAARTAYDALSEDAQALVTNIDTLTAAETAYESLQVAAVIALIDAIGEVTLDSGDAITAARTAYDALSEDAQALVTNIDTLTAAEEAYAALEAEQDNSDTLQAEADVVIALIDAIGDVTLDSEDAITAARTAYDALSEDAQALVTNIDTLTAAEASYAELLAEKEAAEALQEEAEAVIALIDAIGDVTLGSEDAITAARTAYDALSEEAQALVTNIDTLTAAEEAYAALEAEKEAAEALQAEADAVIALIDAIGEVTLDSEDAITAARTAYDALSEEAQALVTNIDTLTAAESSYAELLEEKEAAEALQAEAEAVIALIDAIGEVTLESEDAIAAARAAYDALSEEAQALVTNIDTLTAAETSYEELAAEEEAAEALQAEAEAVIALIEAIGDVTLDSGEAIAAARAAYDALSEEAQALVTNIDTLTEAESTYEALEAEQNNTDDGTGDTDDGTGEDSDAGTGSDDDANGEGDTTNSGSGSIENSTSQSGSSGSKSKKVKLSKGKIKRLKNKKGRKVKVTYKKDKKAGGYQIVYSTKKNFKSKKKVKKVKGKKKTSVTLKKLKKNKTYYVKVRSYKKVNGKIYYGAWSKVKKVKVKK